MAKERGQLSVEGDVFKWLGHAYNRMGDTKGAEEKFSEGKTGQLYYFLFRSNTKNADIEDNHNRINYRTRVAHRVCRCEPGKYIADFARLKQHENW